MSEIAQLPQRAPEDRERMNARVFVGLLLLAPLLLFSSCDLSEPTDRKYNSAAHPPAVGDLQALGIKPGEGLAGQVFFPIDSTLGVPGGGGGAPLLIDGEPVNGSWFSPTQIGFDTRLLPDGAHTLTVGLMKPGGGPSETGLMGYLGAPDRLYSGDVVLRQTTPYELPVQPFAPWDNDLRQRPAIDAARGTLYVMERDTVKALATSTNTLLRARRLTGTWFYSVTALRHFALSADGTRLYVYVVLDLSSYIYVLNALTFDSLAAVQASFPVYGMVCGDAGRLFVSSGPASGLPGGQGVVRVLNTATLAQVSELTLPVSVPMGMVLTNDRKTLFLASDGVCRVSVESSTPVLQAQRKTGAVASIGVSPDAQRLFLAHNQDPGYGVSYEAWVTVRNASTLDSTGTVELGLFTTNVWDILPSGEDLFAVLSVWTGSSTGRVARYSKLAAMTASWEFGMYVVPVPLQVSGDGRSLYASGGALCIPLP